MIGKWNKSVILSYIGLSLSVLGVFLLFKQIDTKYVLVCLMFAGICDLFDGTVARCCKRTKEEKAFGIELDSIIDVFNFIAFPIIIFNSLKINTIYALPIYILYSIFGIARLAHFNITTENNNKPVKYYEGLPVTYAALLFPLFYLLSFIIKISIFKIIYLVLMVLISIMFIIKLKVPKPKLIGSLILLLLAIIISILYLFVL